jgi:heptosyltransferase-1
VSSLGDVVHAFPVVADTLCRYPHAQIDWLVEEEYVDLVKLVRRVHRVIPFGLRRWRHQLLSRVTWREIRDLRRELATQHYDVIVDCQGLLKTAISGRWAKGALVGLGNRTDGSSYEWPVRFFYDRCITIPTRTHVVTRSRQLVAAALGDAMSWVDPNQIDFGLDVDAACHAFALMKLPVRDPYIIFLHATSRVDKRWDLASWIEVGKMLAKQSFSIVLPWGNEAERAVSEQIAQACGFAAYVPPRLSLPVLVGLIQKARLTIGVDTGLTHIAAALKRPTIALYNFDTAWRSGGYWCSDVVNLGSAAQFVTLEDVQHVLRKFGLLVETSEGRVSRNENNVTI